MPVTLLMINAIFFSIQGAGLRVNQVHPTRIALAKEPAPCRD